MLLFALAFWLDLEWVTMRFPQVSRGGMAYYEHVGGGHSHGPGPNTGLRASFATRASPAWSFGVAASGIWGHLGGRDKKSDAQLMSYTWQLGLVARYTFAEILDSMNSRVAGSVRGELGIAGIHARADGEEVDSARRPYGALALEMRYGNRVFFVGSLGTTQPLGGTKRLVADEVVPMLPVGGFEMLVGIGIER